MSIISISKILVAVVVTLCAETLFAGSTNDLINRERLRRDKGVKEVIKDNSDFINNQKNLVQKIHDHPKTQKTIDAIKNRYLEKSKINGGIKQAPQASQIPQVVVFVSFSVPDLSLKQIIQDAAYYRVPVVIRGLYQNSFRKTMEKIFELVKDSNKGGIAINPRWFKEYEIEAVPAVVIRQEFNTTSATSIVKKSKKNDVVYGNIPLKRALEIIAERGTHPDVVKTAKNILGRANSGNGGSV